MRTSPRSGRRPGGWGRGRGRSARGCPPRAASRPKPPPRSPRAPALSPSSSSPRGRMSLTPNKPASPRSMSRPEKDGSAAGNHAAILLPEPKVRKRTPAAVSRRQKAARGVLVVILLKVTGTGIARLAQLVIPLFLLPTDLGIFALAAVFSGLLLLVGELGLTTELLRRRERVSETMNTAFVLRTVLGLGLLGASVPVAYGVALAYREAQVALPIVVLSLGLLFHAVVMVPRVVAARDLDFRRSLAPDSVGKYTVSIATIGFAVLGLAFWSPVFGTLLGYGVGTVLQLAVTKWRPRWEFRADLARSLLRFGRYITLATLMTSVAQSLDTAVVGLLLGVGSLAVYALALSWGVFLTSNLSSVFSTVAYPVLAEASDAPARMRRAFLENLRYYTYLAVALSLGVVVFAPLFVTALYAAQWGPAIVPMQILAVRSEERRVGKEG